jgi:hypothetical protein
MTKRARVPGLYLEVLLRVLLIMLLDFAKAFDNVPHRRLLHKLKFYGVDGTTLAWISSFLSRKQLVLLHPMRW